MLLPPWRTKEKGMEFRVAERMMLLNLLRDAEGDVTMLRIVRDTQSKLGFSEEELEALDIRQDATQMRWKGKADQPVEIDLGRKATKLITEKLEQLNAEKKLTVPQLSLYDKFVEDEDPDDEEKGE